MFVEGNPAPTFKFYKVDQIKFKKIGIIFLKQFYLKGYISEDVSLSP